MGNSIFTVGQDTVLAIAEGGLCIGKANKMAYQIVTDFYTEMAIENRVWQVRAGTINVPLVGDIVVTDAAAEFAVDPATGYVIIPVVWDVAVVVGGGTLDNYAAKSVAGASSVGAAYVPLNCSIGGPACNSTSRVAAAAGGVTVPAELATTTRVHFYYANAAANVALPLIQWVPRCPPVIGSGNVLYFQVAGTGTPNSYYSHFDFIELPLTGVS